MAIRFRPIDESGQAAQVAPQQEEQPQTGLGRLIKAAGYVQRFVNPIPYAAADVAGAAYNSSPVGYAAEKGKQLESYVQKQYGDANEEVGRLYPGEGAGDKIRRISAAGVGATMGAVAKAQIPRDRLGVLLTAAQVVPGAVGMAGRAAEAMTGAGADAAAGFVRGAGSTVSKIPQAAFESLDRNPLGTLNAARKGMTVNFLTDEPIAVAMQEAHHEASAAQNMIDESAAGAGKAMGEMKEALAGAPHDAARVDVAGTVFDKMEPYIKSKTSYASQMMSPTTKEEAGIFNDFYARIKSTAQEGMAPQEVNDLLEQMTTEQQAHRGSKLSAHLAELKKTLLDALPDTLKTGEEMIDIAGPRAGYKTAMDAERAMAPFTGKDNGVGAIRSAARAGGEVMGEMVKYGEANPEFAKKLENVKTLAAGAKFAPKLTYGVPATGITAAAMGALGHAVSGNILGALGAGSFALGASPRAVGESYAAIRAAKGPLSNWAGEAARALTSVGGTVYNSINEVDNKDNPKVHLRNAVSGPSEAAALKSYVGSQR